MTFHIAVDGGQSGLRLALFKNRERVYDARARGFNHQASSDRVESLAEDVTDAIRDALGRFDESISVERICLGLTGAPRATEDRARLAKKLRSNLDAGEVCLGPDMVTSHAGALRGKPGVVLAAGTGVVCLGIAPNGVWAQGDGHGFLLGDDGSGFAIGQAGLRAVLRELDGRGPVTAMSAAAELQFGPLAFLSSIIYRSDTFVSDIAGFAPHVARAARGGDPVARRIWSFAAEQLAQTASAVVQRTFIDSEPASVAVSCVGQLFCVSDLLATPFQAALERICPAADVQPAMGDGLDGAAAIALGDLEFYAPMMHYERTPQ